MRCVNIRRRFLPVICATVSPANGQWRVVRKPLPSLVWLINSCSEWQMARLTWTLNHSGRHGRVLSKSTSSSYQSMPILISCMPMLPITMSKLLCLRISKNHCCPSWIKCILLLPIPTNIMSRLLNLRMDRNHCCPSWKRCIWLFSIRMVSLQN